MNTGVVENVGLGGLALAIVYFMGKLVALINQYRTDASKREERYAELLERDIKATEKNNAVAERNIQTLERHSQMVSESIATQKQMNETFERMRGERDVVSQKLIEMLQIQK